MPLVTDAARQLEAACSGAARIARAPIAKAEAAIGSLGHDAYVSALHFDERAPGVRTLVQDLGWDAGTKARAGLLTDATYAKYTTDGWKSSAIAPLQYLRDGYQGFLLRGVAPGTPVEFAVQAKVGLTHNNFYSLDQTVTRWLTTWGNNLKALAEKP